MVLIFRVVDANGAGIGIQRVANIHRHKSFEERGNRIRNQIAVIFPPRQSDDFERFQLASRIIARQIDGQWIRR